MKAIDALKNRKMIFDLRRLKVSTKFSIRFLSVVLVFTGGLLVFLGVYDYRAEQAVKQLQEHYLQIEHLRSEIIHFDEILTSSARMAAATGDPKWEQRYNEVEPQLSADIRLAVRLSPEIYRSETDRTNIGKIQLLDMEHKAFTLIRSGRGKEAMEILFGQQYESQKVSYVRAIERLNTFLKKQMEAALLVEKSKEYLVRISFITVLILLLLSWLIILRIARYSQDALVELNRTLDQKVRERTQSLADAFHQLRRTHTDLKHIQAQLLQSEKFSAIGQLAAGVAHEINNPLGFINSNLQTLEDYFKHYRRLLGILNKLEKALRDKDQEGSAQAVATWEKFREETNFVFIGNDIGDLIKESGEGIEKIRQIIIALRTFGSPDKGTMDSVDLNALIESTLNIAWNEIKYKASLRKEYGQVPPIVCNPQKIGQVLLHLLINAAHAIQDKGCITIKTYKEGEHACVEVCDTGCGIPPENVTNIFNPFFTTKPAGQGAGLGLSISYDIIRKHAGTLTFTSQAQKGTTFIVRLPLAQACSLGVVKEGV